MSIEVIGGDASGLIIRAATNINERNSREIYTWFSSPIPERIQSCHFRMIENRQLPSGAITASIVLNFSFGGSRILPQTQVACGELFGVYATSPLGNYCGLCDIYVSSDGQTWTIKNMRFADGTYIEFPTNSSTDVYYTYSFFLYGVDS